MGSSGHGRFQRQAKFLCQQFVQDADLPLCKLLSDELVAQAMTAIQLVWLDRIYSPLITLWVFLTQTHLRCKSPELVRKEIWTHALAYNLIRIAIAQAATTHKLVPRSISFKGAVQTLEAFQPTLERAVHSPQRASLYQNLLEAIATHRVGDRPNRFEPRVKKRRLNQYGWLMQPRAEIKRKMAQGVTEI
jgi:hypothetical protein